MLNDCPLKCFGMCVCALVQCHRKVDFCHYRLPCMVENALQIILSQIESTNIALHRNNKCRRYTCQNSNEQIRIEFMQ